MVIRPGLEPGQSSSKLGMLTITSSDNKMWEYEDSNLRTQMRTDLQSVAIATMRYSQVKLYHFFFYFISIKFQYFFTPHN